MTRSALDARDCRILAEALGVWLRLGVSGEDRSRGEQMRAVFDLLSVVEDAEPGAPQAPPAGPSLPRL